MAKPVADGGYGKARRDRTSASPTSKPGIDVGHGDVLIAAITSCTNTSNPGVLLAAGLLAKKAVEKGLKPHPRVKTSLATGLARGDRVSRRTRACCPTSSSSAIYVVGYGCTTCIGNSGPLDAAIEEAVTKNDLVARAVLSGNRNFEARMHQAIRANFLMSPPLVVAFALAGTVNIDMSKDPLGNGKDGKPVYLSDIWPSAGGNRRRCMKYATDPEMFKKVFSAFKEGNPLWDEIPAAVGATYQWDPKSTYVRAAAVLRRLRHAAGHGRRRQGRARARHLRRLDHDRPHQPRRRHPRRARPPASTCRSTASRSPTSTPTARAAATTRS